MLHAGRAPADMKSSILTATLRPLWQTWPPSLLSSPSFCVAIALVLALPLVQLADAIQKRLLKPLLGEPDRLLKRHTSALFDSIVLVSPENSTSKDNVAAEHSSLLDRVRLVCTSVEVLVSALHQFVCAANYARDPHAGSAAETARTWEYGDISAYSASLSNIGSAFWSGLVRALCNDFLLPAWADEMDRHRVAPSCQGNACSLSEDRRVGLVAQITMQMASLDDFFRRVGLDQLATTASFAADLLVHASEEHARGLLSQATIRLHSLPTRD